MSITRDPKFWTELKERLAKNLLAKNLEGVPDKKFMDALLSPTGRRVSFDFEAKYFQTFPRSKFLAVGGVTGRWHSSPVPMTIVDDLEDAAYECPCETIWKERDNG